MRSKFWLISTGLLLAGVAVLESFQTVSKPTGETPSATYAQGTLRVAIPYDARRAGAGQLTVEVLNPEDQSIGSLDLQTSIPAGKGWWREDIKIANGLALDDLVWHRLHYRFVYNDSSAPPIEGIDSISEILRRPVIHILGQQSYLSGGPAAVRVIVTDSKNEPIAGPSTLRIDMPQARTLFSGPLNARGTAEAQFRLPGSLAGTFPLRYVVDTPIGSAEFTQQIRIEDKVSILLTTEKPLYQPGQMIHVRALALDRANHEAAASRALTFELEDPRGNKVFKRAAQTDKFGVASAEFGLADEVNLGTYHLRALMDSNTSEIALNVERYVLPKFKVAIEFAGPTGGKANSHGYRPGEHVTGTVRANYFFGKPVDHAEVTLKGTGMDVSTFEAGSVSGKTDGDGAYHFDLKLPAYFAGKPLSGGAARVVIEATVKDSSGHPETRGEPITVSESPLIITAIPEGGTLIPNLDNQVFILTSYADGKPASGNIRVHAAGNADQTVTADQGGIAIVRVHSGVGNEKLDIEASDQQGNRATASIDLQPRAGDDQILLRADRAVYRPGERIQLKVFSTKKQGAAYVDIVKDGQTVLTRDLDLTNGAAELTLPAPAFLAGAVDFNAYLIGRDARPVADHRLIFIQPADDLKIEATADAASYKPGDDAHIRFRVTNSRGEGVQAALGVQVVDEAVFALAEKQPGFAKVFFYLEQEAMKPRYEIHSIGMPDIVEPVAARQAVQRDRAARALFAATELVNSNKFETEVGRTPPQAKYAAYYTRYQSRFQAQLRDIAKTIPSSPNLRDAWGAVMRFDSWGNNMYRVSSAGPDKKFNTIDDLAVLVDSKSGRVSPLGMGFGGGAGIGVGAVGGIARGAIFDGVRELSAQRAMAPPAAAPLFKAEFLGEPAAANTVAILKDGPRDAGAAGPAVRVRSYFPEALYINPEIITDSTGRASISIPMADSITTWRMAMLASTPRGALGTGTSSLKVFQDFFVDLDLPVTLTQGDRVSIPVAVYNYSSTSGEVSLQLKPEDWFSLAQDTPAKTVQVESGRVGGSQFTVEAQRIGKFKLTLTARMNGHTDIVVREIEVVPNGREQTQVFNGRLESSAAHDIRFPASAIPDAGKIFVRLYPGPLSQVIEGMDAILRMPGGCFEQTSSSTYPNVLALDYMKSTKKLTPEIHAKAEGFIANGYQRLLTFEVPGGGFSWFGQAPANKILTAYGLMEFSDMAKVYDVDPKLIQRTQQWLASQQQVDGSWKPDTNFINEGATNRFNTDALRITAYIAWSLENTGYQGPAVEKARQYIGQHMNIKADAYTLAVLANFAVDYGKDRDFTRQAMQQLLDARTEKDEQAWWNAQETAVFATGSSAAVETTGLAVQALLKWGQASGTATKALNYIASKKGAQGNWGTTQATIMALRALLLSTSKSASDVRGSVEVTLNGKPVQQLNLTPDNNDLFHQFVFKNVDFTGSNQVALKFSGTGGLAYQVVGDYFIPWDQKPANEALSINVAYDRTTLAQNDTALATATIKNNLPKTANMVMVDLGIPPGFDLLTEDLQKIARLQKFNLTGTQAILYFDKLNPNETLTLQFHLRAKYPIRAKTFPSRVYEYYNPEVNAVARPVQLEVRK